MPLLKLVMWERLTSLFDNNPWYPDPETDISLGFLGAYLGNYIETLELLTDRVEGARYINYRIFESCIASRPRPIQACQLLVKRGFHVRDSPMGLMYVFSKPQMPNT